MTQESSHAPTPLRWWLLRSLVEGLRILCLLTGWVAPLVLFIVLFISNIIRIVNGSETLLDGVAAFLATLILYSAVAGVVFLALLAMIALLEWVLPPAYRPPYAKGAPPELAPSVDQAKVEPTTAVPVPCPDARCDGFLNRPTSASVYPAPHTDKQVYPSLVYGGGIRLLWFGVGFLTWVGAIVVGTILFPGSTLLSPAAKTLDELGFIAGVVVFVAGIVFSQRKKQAALRHAEEYASCQCPRCGKWWLLKSDAPLSTRE